MKYRNITRRAAGLAVLFAAVSGGSAQAETPAQIPGCDQPSYSLSQPYLGSGDSNWYTLASGQGPGGFSAAGWTLTGGARLVTTKLADGSTGTVLDLPAEAIAVSPAMCVNSQFPTARLTMRQAGNGPGMKVTVAYAGGKTKGQSSGSLVGGSAWGVSRAFELHADNLTTWTRAQYTFEGSKGEAQVYNFYVDPHCFR